MYRHYIKSQPKRLGKNKRMTGLELGARVIAGVGVGIRAEARVKAGKEKEREMGARAGIEM